MLSFIDNPFDYFTDFINWRMFDIEFAQRNNCLACCEYLARIVQDADDMTQKERDAEIERAIDEIILYDFRNVYKKIEKEVEIIEPLEVVETL